MFLYIVKLLQVCPWYEDLEPVLRDQPMARPMQSQDYLGLTDLGMQSFAPNQTSQDNADMDPNDSEVYKGWMPTPPRDVPDQDDKVTGNWLLHPALKGLLPSSSNGSLEDITCGLPCCRSITPSAF